jgi:2-polyprenyl-3-methyl-5-hydroxy-6-metoxy-1,4-benzoquinol methylase
MEIMSQNMDVQSKEQIMRTRPSPNCLLCGAEGKLLYHDLQDRLFDVPGKWNVRNCPKQSCGLIWLDPMPTEEDIFKAYLNYYTHKDSNQVDSWRKLIFSYIKEGYFGNRYGYPINSYKTGKRLLGFLIYFHPLRRVTQDINVMFLKPKHKGFLLEIGCGSGGRLKLMQQLGWKVEGVDFDPIAVESAKGKGLVVHLGTLEAQTYPDNKFDSVTMSHFIEHVHDPLQLLGECYRILKPKGSLVITTPNGRSWGHTLFKKAWIHLDPPRHLHIFGLQTIRQIVEQTGFHNITLTTTLHWGDVTFPGSRAIKESGQYIPYSFQSLGLRIWARTMEFMEYSILKMNHGIGEEIVLIAEK